MLIPFALCAQWRQMPSTWSSCFRVVGMMPWLLNMGKLETLAHNIKPLFKKKNGPAEVIVAVKPFTNDDNTDRGAFLYHKISRSKAVNFKVEFCQSRRHLQGKKILPHHVTDGMQVVYYLYIMLMRIQVYNLFWSASSCQWQFHLFQESQRRWTEMDTSSILWQLK